MHISYMHIYTHMHACKQAHAHSTHAHAFENITHEFTQYATPTLDSKQVSTHSTIQATDGGNLSVSRITSPHKSTLLSTG